MLDSLGALLVIGQLSVRQYRSTMRYTPEQVSRALSIVEALLPKVSPRQEYGELVEVLREPARWHEAHALFNKIRVNITLPTESHRKSELDSLFVYVAENAAKTAYNC